MHGSDTPLAAASGAEKSRKRRAVDILQRIYDTYPPSLFIDRARTLHHELRLGGPPIDPWEVAKRLNIEVKERSMALDGYLERSDDETFVIFVRRETPLPRKRFTICHEIAHTFFLDILADQRKFRQGQTDCRQQDDPDEEWLCNIAAAELLMPFSSFNGDVTEAQRTGGLTPDSVLKLMSRYQASLQAVAARITWVSRSTTCVLWEKKGPAINLLWAAPSRTRSLVLCQTGKSSVELAAGAAGRKVVTSNDSFYILDGGTRLIRRRTSSRRLRSGQILSVLSPISASSKESRLGNSDSAQVQLAFSFR